MADGRDFPIIANALVYVAGDTIAEVGSATDVGGDLTIANLVDPNLAYQTLQVGRVDTAAQADGVEITLATETTVSTVEVGGIADNPLPDGHRIRIVGENAAAAESFRTESGAGGGHYVKFSDVWTGFVPTPANVLVRYLAIPGVDDLTTPAQPGTPALTTWLCKKLEYTNRTAGTSYIELAYIALGIEGHAFKTGLELSQVGIKEIELLSGRGYHLTVSWDKMIKKDADALMEAKRRASGGKDPVFFCPWPSETATADGTVSAAERTPALRGGLMRFSSLGGRWITEWADGWYVRGVQATFETWQEEPAPGGR